jgi:hypothetical protein
MSVERSAPSASSWPTESAARTSSTGSHVSPHQAFTGSYVDPRAGLVTVEAFAEQWRAGQVWRPSSVERTRIMLACHVYPALGRRPLAHVRPSEVQAG